VDWCTPAAVSKTWRAQLPYHIHEVNVGEMGGDDLMISSRVFTSPWNKHLKRKVVESRDLKRTGSSSKYG